MRSKWVQHLDAPGQVEEVEVERPGREEAPSLKEGLFQGPGSWEAWSYAMLFPVRMLL